MTFREYLAREGITAGAFARRTGLDRVQCYRWAGGHRTPSIDDATIIERATEGAVPIDVWASEEARTGALPVVSSADSSTDAA